MSFYLANKDKYDYIWNIEYDVCVYGKWEIFFKKYESSDVDLITWRIKNDQQFLNNFYWYKIIPNNIKIKLQSDFYTSLNCLTRVSSRLLPCIINLFKQINDPCVFLEWIWITAAKMNNMRFQQFESNCFRFSFDMTKFNDYKIDFPYHPIKFNIKWNDVLKNILKNIQNKGI